MAIEDKKRGVTRPDIFDAKPNPSEVGALPRKRKAKLLRKKFTGISPPTVEKIGLGESSSDLLKLLVGETLSSITFPPKKKELVFTVTRGKDRFPAGKGVERDVYDFKTGKEVPAEYERIFDTLLDNPLGAGLFRKLTSNVRSRSVEIHIPLEEGKVNAVGASFEAVR